MDEVEKKCIIGTGIDAKKELAVRTVIKSSVYALAILGGIFIILLLVLIGLLRQNGAVIKDIPADAVLEVNFDAVFDETRGDNLWDEINGNRSVSFSELNAVIRQAAEDSRISVLYGRVNNSSLGLAQIQELRQAVMSFRAAGKRAILFSPGFGGLGNGTSEYYLAAAFDEIIMQPQSEAGITGIGIEVPFLRGLLDKLGISPEFYARYEYKTAMAPLIDKAMTRPFREELERLGSSFYNQIAADIAVNRNLSVQQVKNLVNRAPLSAEDALNAGLIDKMAFRQEAEAFWPEEQIIKTADYAAHLKNGKKRAPAVAVLTVSGVISDGRSGRSSLQGDLTAGAETIIEQLEEITEDENVKAVVLRIDSPGGSFGASDEIRNGLAKLKKDRKIPLIVSMGNYAASGGYFIALPADKIFAEPATVTGSIGVLGGKLVLSGLWKKLGVDWELIKYGENSGMLSSNQNFTQREKANFNKSLDRIYEDFTLKVSQARNITPGRMDKLARGRIWTGAEAVENGLADDNGGLSEAITAAMKAAGLKEGEKIRKIYYPKPKSLQEKLEDLLGSGPQAAVNRLQSDLGLDNDSLIMLKRLQYDLMMAPVKLYF